MIAKFKMRLITRVLALILMASIVGHVLVFGDLAFSDNQTPGKIGFAWAALILVTQISLLVIVLVRDGVTVRPRPSAKRISR